MPIKLRFLGAAQNVTGYCYFLNASGLRLLVDCGLYQERNLKERNWALFPVDPKSINALLFIHGHGPLWPFTETGQRGFRSRT